MASTASTSTLRRLMKEYQNEQEQQQQESSSSSSLKRHAARDENVVDLRPKDTESLNLLEWRAVIRGPVGGFYEGGTFNLEIVVPPTYPIKPPSIHFKSKMWHPNVSWK
ncbi:hypothetical protein CBS101457_001109 [Exobasidium rhododendri]|nr:hypothetical protein CBS101457_001109 [Exobasidium rhododendri]